MAVNGIFLVLMVWLVWTVYYTYTHHKGLLMGDLTLKKELILIGNIVVAIILFLALVLLGIFS